MENAFGQGKVWLCECDKCGNTVRLVPVDEYAAAKGHHQAVKKAVSLPAGLRFLGRDQVKVYKEPAPIFPPRPTERGARHQGVRGVPSTDNTGGGSTEAATTSSEETAEVGCSDPIRIQPGDGACFRRANVYRNLMYVSTSSSDTEIDDDIVGPDDDGDAERFRHPSFLHAGRRRTDDSRDPKQKFSSPPLTYTFGRERRTIFQAAAASIRRPPAPPPSVASSSAPDSWPPITVHFLGDPGCGKSRLVDAFASGKTPFARTILTSKRNGVSHCRVELIMDGRPVEIRLWDNVCRKQNHVSVIGKPVAPEDGNPFLFVDKTATRHSSMKSLHVFVICYSVVNRNSFRNVYRRWFSNAITCSVVSPIFLLGTKADIRDELGVTIKTAFTADSWASRKEVGDVRLAARRHARHYWVSAGEGKRVARRLGFLGSQQCSAETMWNLHEALDHLVRSTTKYHANLRRYEDYCRDSKKVSR